MGTLTLNYLQDTGKSVRIPVKELETRVIQFYQNEYTAGTYTPTTSYAWVPGAYVDFTPLRSDTRIKYTMRLPYKLLSSTHAISHWHFVAAGQTYYSWSESAENLANTKTFEFDVASWGTTQERIGLEVRNYSGSLGLIMYATRYWNGTTSEQVAYGHLFVEEILI